MANRIKESMTKPEELENLYRSNKQIFEADFRKIYEEIRETDLAGFWKTRLDFDKPKPKQNLFIRADALVLGLACLVAGILIKLPEIININLNEFMFYEKNAAIIVFFGLSVFTSWKTQSYIKKNIILSVLAFLIPALYINLLPSNQESDSINLAYIH
jgi:hypothetical protein